VAGVPLAVAEGRVAVAFAAAVAARVVVGALVGALVGAIVAAGAADGATLGAVLGAVLATTAAVGWEVGGAVVLVAPPQAVTPRISASASVPRCGRRRRFTNASSQIFVQCRCSIVSPIAS